MNPRVTSLRNAERDFSLHAPTHVISMMDPSVDPARVPKFGTSASVLQLFFYDDDDLDQQTEPVIVSLRRILAFLREFIATPGDTSLLLHCHAGASRSPGVAYIYLAMRLGPGNEDRAFAELFEFTNKPWPSRHLVELADEELGLEGRLLRPLDAYRARFPRRYDAYMRLNRRRSL